MGQNVRVRKLLIGAIATVTAVVVGAVGADFGAAIYAEYRLARSVRTAAKLSFDPWVSILGFPFITQATRRRYNEIVEQAAHQREHVACRWITRRADWHLFHLLEIIGCELQRLICMMSAKIV